MKWLDDNGKILDPQPTVLAIKLRGLTPDAEDYEREVEALTTKLAAAERALVEAQAVITELVACKELKTKIDGLPAGGRLASYGTEYSMRKPLAWEAARNYLAGNRTTALDAHVQKVCGEPVLKILANNCVGFLQPSPPAGTILYAPTFTTDTGAKHG